MHIVLLLLLLISQSIHAADDSVVNAPIRTNMAPLPDNFAYTAFSEDCVGSMQGCIFKANTDSPIIYLSTLMLLHQEKETCSDEHKERLHMIQNCLQVNMQQLQESLTALQGIHTCVKKAFQNVYDQLWSQKKQQESTDREIFQQLMQCACAGSVRVLTSDTSYVTFLKESPDVPFKVTHTQVAWPKPMDQLTYFTKTDEELAAENVALLLERFHKKSDRLDEATKNLLGCLKNPKCMVTLIDAQRLGFRKADENPLGWSGWLALRLPPFIPEAYQITRDHTVYE